MNLNTQLNAGDTIVDPAALVAIEQANEQIVTPTSVTRVGETIVVDYSDTPSPAAIDATLKMADTIGRVRKAVSYTVDGEHAAAMRELTHPASISPAQLAGIDVPALWDGTPSIEDITINQPEVITEEMTQELALKTQSIVAERLLEAQGWDIIAQLFKITSQMVQTTSMYVLPVITEEELIREKLGEYYEAFAQSFQLLRDDLGTMTELLIALSKRHEGRAGAVAEEDNILVTEIALGYSKLQTQMEDQVGPEMFKQMQQLEAAGVGADVLLEAFQRAQAQPE